MSVAGTRAYLLVLGSAIAVALSIVAGPNGKASAESGTQGFDSNDFCGKIAILEMEMISGFENQQEIDLPATVLTEIKCLLGDQAAAPAALIPVRLEGNLPWVDVEGDFVFDGTLLAEGSGTVAGTPNARVVLDVTVTTEYEITGQYTMGADGELGDPAVYEVGGVFGTDTLPTPTSSPMGDEVVWGDNNCSNQVEPVDSLLTLRFNAGLNANTGACPGMGTEVDVLNASLHLWGDFDCTDVIDPIDSLKVLRFNAGLGISQEGDCPEPGSQVIVTVP